MTSGFEFNYDQSRCGDFCDLLRVRTDFVVCIGAPSYAILVVGSRVTVIVDRNRGKSYTHIRKQGVKRALRRIKPLYYYHIII